MSPAAISAQDALECLLWVDTEAELREGLVTHRDMLERSLWGIRRNNQNAKTAALRILGQLLRDATREVLRRCLWSLHKGWALQAQRRASHGATQSQLDKAELEAKLAAVEARLQSLLQDVQSETLKWNRQEAKLKAEREELRTQVLFLEGSLAKVASSGARRMEQYKARHSVHRPVSPEHATMLSDMVRPTTIAPSCPEGEPSLEEVPAFHSPTSCQQYLDAAYGKSDRQEAARAVNMALAQQDPSLDPLYVGSGIESVPKAFELSIRAKLDRRNVEDVNLVRAPGPKEN